MTCEPFNVLLVEDEQAHAELTQRAILKAGHANRVDVVVDGEEAFDYLFNRGKYTDKGRYATPCLILLDIKLPGMDGIEVLKRIKKHDHFRKIPVVMLTTSNRAEDVVASYSNHANSYLTKPVSYEEFDRKIRQLDTYWMLVNTPPIV